MIVTFARALVDWAMDWQFDVPAPCEHWIGDEIDIDVAEQHRPAVMGFEPHARIPVFYPEGHRHRRTCPEFPMPPARGERIEREGLPKVHHGHDRPAIGFQNLAPPAEKVPANQADDRYERAPSDQEISSMPRAS